MATQVDDKKPLIGPLGAASKRSKNRDGGATKKRGKAATKKATKKAPARKPAAKKRTTRSRA